MATAKFTRRGMTAAGLALLGLAALNALGFGLIATFAAAVFGIALTVIVRGVINDPLRFAEAADAEDLEVRA